MNAISKCWNNFFFSPCSPLPMSLCRILLALVFLFALVLMGADLSTWYGDSAAVSSESARIRLPHYLCFSWMCLPGITDNIVFLFYCLALISACSLLLGWHSRISAIFSFVIFQGFMRRNPFILSGSDELLSQMLFYVILSDAGKLLSLDSLMLKKRGISIPLMTAPWAQRLLQMELCLIYLQTFYLKMLQADWQQGTALQKVLQTRELLNYPIPDFISHAQMLCQFLTWSTLAIELVLPIFLWIRPWRNYVVIFAVCFHLAMEYCLNIPMFQPLMIACLITFLEPFSIKRVFVRCRRLFKKLKSK